MKRTFLALIALFVLNPLVYSQDNNHYGSDFNHYDYQTHKDVNFLVAIDGNLIETTDSYYEYEVGFFVGEDYRGGGYMQLEYPDDPYPTTNYSSIFYTEPNEPIICKLYDHNKNIEYTVFTCVDGDDEPVSLLTGTEYDYFDDGVCLSFSSSFSIDIAQYSENGGWYLIASPLAATVSPTVVENMISSTEANYDLYFFDQAGTGNGKEWKNWKEDVNGGSTNHGFNLVPGTGYLYANSQDVTLTFIGAPYNGTNVVELSRAATVAHEKMRGWNLIGNSFTTAKTIGGRGYYRMNPVGRSELIAGTGNIDAMEGIFVYYDPEDDNAANREETVTFTNPSLKRAEGDDMVLLTLNRNNDGTIDRVIVRFDEGGTLPKYTLRDNSTIIYIPQADKDYAVVKGSATNVFPVNFKTEDFGTYTLSADIAGANVDYMHLIDKITGEDVDMLLEGEYSFVAAPVDREDRFILRLNYSGYFDNESDIFAYQNGSDIVVCGEGTLQVFDVMGRYVTSYEVNGVQSIQAMPMGVYIFRMLGDDVKTQKIYVR